MLRYFRINDPYRLISLLVLLTLASLPFLMDLPGVTLQELKGFVLGEQVASKMMYVEIIDHTPPLQAMIDGFLNFVFGRSILGRHILALIVLFFQASYFGILLINNRAYNENTYVPSLIFGFLCFFSFDLLSLTPEVIASTLLLLALNNLFKEIEFRVDRDANVLNLGVFLGLASLIVFSYTVFLLGAVIILIVFARATARKILLLLFGYVLAHGFVFTYYYYMDHSGDLWMNFYVAGVSQARLILVSVKSLVILGAVPIVYFIISLFMLTREARFTRYQSQLFQVLFFWLGIAVIEVFLSAEVTPHSVVTFIPSLAYFISHYLLLIRRKRIAEFMFWVFIVGLLAVSLSARKQWIPAVDYSSLFPAPSRYAEVIRNKRVMIIGDDIGLYQQNFLGGYFLDWELSRIYFEEPDYYEHVIKVYESLENDPPDAIVDEQGLIEPLLERMPRLRASYRKEGAVYWRR